MRKKEFYLDKIKCGEQKIKSLVTFCFTKHIILLFLSERGIFMNKFVLFSDSACDLEVETFRKWNIKYLDLSLSFIDDNKILYNSEINIKDFYQKMRDGRVAKTAAANSESFKKAFEEELVKGNDILYVGFSSGLSTTFNSARLASIELMEKYPDRKIKVVDSLCASAGQAMLLYFACQQRDSGVDLIQAAKYLEDIKLNMCHFFTVSDLVYLKRGGRISSATAFVGGLLGIKPVLHVDNDGHLVSIGKVRGRRHSIKALAQKYGEYVKEQGKGPIYICHGDCIDDVDLLKRILKEDYGVEVDMIVNTGPVIGAHSGPGTLALFFVGRER